MVFAFLLVAAEVPFDADFAESGMQSQTAAFSVLVRFSRLIIHYISIMLHVALTMNEMLNCPGAWAV
jgi:hypothetical protein